MVLVFKKFNIVYKGTFIGNENPLLFNFFFENIPNQYAYEFFEHLIIYEKKSST